MNCRSTSVFCFVLVWGIVLMSGFSAPAYADLYDDFESGNLAKWVQEESTQTAGGQRYSEAVTYGTSLWGHVRNKDIRYVRFYTGFPFAPDMTLQFKIDSITNAPITWQCTSAHFIYKFKNSSGTEIAKVYYLQKNSACDSLGADPFIETDTNKNNTLGLSEEHTDTINDTYFQNQGISIDINSIAYIELVFECYNTHTDNYSEIWVDDVNVSGIPTVVKGDVNGDDIIDFTDVQTAVKTAAGVDTTGEIDDLFKISGKSAGGDVRVDSAEAVHDIQVLNNSRTVP